MCATIRGQFQGQRQTEEEAGTTRGADTTKIPGFTSHFSTQGPHLFPPVKDFQSYAFSLSKELESEQKPQIHRDTELEQKGGCPGWHSTGTASGHLAWFPERSQVWIQKRFHGKAAPWAQTRYGAKAILELVLYGKTCWLVYQQCHRTILLSQWNVAVVWLLRKCSLQPHHSCGIWCCWLCILLLLFLCISSTISPRFLWEDSIKQPWVLSLSCFIL